MSPLFGVSGEEGLVREYIKEQLKDIADEMYEDALGSLVVLKKGKYTPKQRLMIDAHIDEVGFMVSEITEDGVTGFGHAVFVRKYAVKQIDVCRKLCAFHRFLDF